MTPPRTYILGGYQTDFARNWSRDGGGLYELLRAAVEGALEVTAIDPAEVEAAHIGNFVGELFAGQGQLGGLFAALHPAFATIPAARHEAACASGSMAALAAGAEIEAGRYDLACVVGVELMRNVPGDQAAGYLGAAAWAGREAQAARFPWPALFSRLSEVYDGRYGLKHEHLARIAQLNFANAKRNPNAQTRGWTFNDCSFDEDDTHNPVIEGRIRKQDCGQITDGAVAILLASERYAAAYARRRGLSLATLPTIRGWGHHTAPMLFEDKIAASQGSPYIFPHVRQTIADALRRAGIESVAELGGIETHDCFTITEYMEIDHFGITPPGQSWRAIEEGAIEPGGRIPINPSGGLIGGGHPVGASGVRMLLDAYKQVTGTAGAYQVAGARTFATLNIGGSATTCASFVVGV
ncbi:MAG TPA: acetyl-CoA acetyltransferase [Ktedonobacterales bacterium]|nr:acetyl-CoA acetyltransferase [Ktedonobacterales bacterium]